METEMEVNTRPLHLARTVSAMWLAGLVLVGCDRSTADLVQEIDAAREGCTEEMLAAGAEECVQMFEKYVDMGSEAIGTYIGAMRALDEALQRRPGLQFDTTGLGHAITPGLERGDTGAVGGWSGQPRVGEDVESYRGARGWEPSSPSWEDSSDPSRRARPTSGPRRQQLGTGGAPEARRSPAMGGRREPVGRSAPAPRPEDTGGRSGVVPPRGERAVPQGRGSILPPDERLRRPWIGDEEPTTQYYPDDAAPPTGDRSRGTIVETGREREPYEDPPRYPF